MTIAVVGVGGTGSQVLNLLGRMNVALLALGKPGLFVTAFDPDKVKEENMARQLFFPSELNTYKAVTMVQRMNRLYGSHWQAIPEPFVGEKKRDKFNIIIGCVDKMEPRKQILDHFSKLEDAYYGPEHVCYYYIDSGNTFDRGQVIMGSRKIVQPPSEFTTVERLPMFDKFFSPKVFDIPDDEEPSCGIAMALNKQDLFVNTFMAANVAGLLWKIMREYVLQYHGFYINCHDGLQTPIHV